MNPTISSTEYHPAADLASLPIPADCESPWYAIRVRPNFEKTVASALRGKGYEEYLPLYTRRSRWSDRIKTLDHAVFPGYVFCRLDVNRRLPVLTTPGVLSIVGFGNTFMPVSEQEIQCVRRIVQSPLVSTPWPYLCAGQRVRVVTGALEGIEGYLVHVKSESRIVISIDLLQRSVAAEVDRYWIEPVGSASARKPAGAAPAAC